MKSAAIRPFSRSVLLLLSFTVWSFSGYSQNNSLRFDGAAAPASQDWVDIPGLPSPGSSFTLEAWIKLDGAQPDQWKTILEFGGDSPYFGLQNGSNFTMAGSAINVPITSDVWTHVAATYDGSTLRLIVNGVEQQSQTSVVLNTTGTSAGIAYHEGDNGFLGWIDEVRVWSIVRDASTINAQRNSELTGSESGLIAYYNFNEGTGTTLGDLAGTPQPGTLQNGDNTTPADGVTHGPVWSTDVPLMAANNALTFDGTNDVVTLQNESNFDFETTDPFTIEAWVRTSTILTKIIASKRLDAGGTYPGYVFWTSNNGISVIIEGTGGNRIYAQASNDGTNVISISTNTWTHLAFSYDGSGSASGVKIFIDGVETLDNRIQSDNLSGSMLNDEPFEIGYQTATSTGWVGEIDEVRVWDFARNPSDIAANYNNELSGSEPNLVTYHDFTTGSGTTSFDVTTFNNGTITGATWSTAGPTIDPEPEINVYGLSVTPGTTEADVDIVSQTTSDLYYVITTSSTQPSSAQILAGQDHTGGSAFNYQNYGSITGLANFSVGNTSFTNGNNLVEGTTYYIYWIGDDDGVDGGNQSEIVSTSFTTLTTPDVTFTSQAITGSTDLYPGSTDNIIYSMQMDVATADATTQGFLFFLGGSFNSGTDFVMDGFKLWANTTNDFGSASQVTTSSYDPSGNPGNGDLAFVFGNTYTAASTTYFWVTADIAAGASPNDFNINTPNPTSNFFFTTTPNYTPSLSVGNTYTIIDTNVENALTFDGFNDFVDISDVKKIDDAVDDYTLEAWFNASDVTTTNYHTVLSYANSFSSAEPYANITMSETAIIFSKRNNAAGEALTLSGPIPVVGQWYHVAAVKDGSSYSLYVNGELVDSNTSATAGTYNRTKVYIGAFGAGDSGNEQVKGFFHGSIDEVKIWNDARTDIEVLADMYEKYPTTADNLAAYWSFDQSAGEVLIDQGPNGHDSQLFGEFGIVSSATNNSIVSKTNEVLVSSALAYGAADMTGSLIRIVDDNPVVVEDRILASNTTNDPSASTNTFTVTEDWTTNPAANTSFMISYNNPTYGSSGAFVPVPVQATNTSTAGTTINWTPFTGTGNILVDINTQADFAGASIVSSGNLGDPSSGAIMVNTTLTANTEYFARLSYQDGTYTSSYSETISFFVDPGYALDLDGTDDYVLTTDNSNLVDLATSGFTLEAWINASSTGLVSILRKTGDFDLYISSNVLYAEVWDDGSTNRRIVTGPAFSSTGTWNHLAFTWNGTAGTFYINGAATAGSNSGLSSIAGVSDLGIGGSSLFGQYFSGQIDEVRIWDDVRTGVEINDNQFSSLSGNEGNLVAYYRFDEITGTDLPDLSGNGNDGTWTGPTGGNTTPNWVISGALQSGATPATPTEFVAYRASSTEVTFAWTDNANDETSFTIESADDFGFTTNLQPLTTVSANTTSTTFNVGASTAKFYRVYASNGSGDSGNSDVAFATTDDYPGTAIDIVSADDLSAGSITELQGTTSFTLEWWFKFDVLGQYQFFNNNGTSSSSRINIATSNGSRSGFDDFEIILENGSNSYANTNGNVLEVGKYYHAALVFDGSGANNAERLRIFLNGEQQAMSFNLTMPTSTSSAALSYTIGNNFDGVIDEMRLWDVVKTDFSDRFTPLNGNEANLVAYYTFDEGGGSSFVDQSTNAYYGSIVGSTYVASAATAPANFTAVANGTSRVDLSWTDMEAETDYILERDVNADFSTATVINLSANTSSYSDFGVTGGNTYYYRLQGVLAGGNSGYSDEASVSIPGIAGNALSFDGVNDYIDLTTHLASFDINAPVTIEFWYKSPNNPASGAEEIFTMGVGANNNEFLIRYGDYGGTLTNEVITKVPTIMNS